MKSLQTPSMALSVKKKTTTIIKEYVEVSLMIPATLQVAGEYTWRPPFPFSCIGESDLRLRSSQCLGDFLWGVKEFRPATKKCLQAFKGMKRAYLSYEVSE